MLRWRAAVAAVAADIADKSGAPTLDATTRSTGSDAAEVAGIAARDQNPGRVSPRLRFVSGWDGALAQLVPKITWSLHRDVAAIVATLQTPSEARADVELETLCVYLQRNLHTRELFGAVPQELLCEIVREATLVTMADCGEDGVLVQQGDSVDACLVVLSGSAALFQVKVEVNEDEPEALPWEEEDVDLDDRGALPVGAAADRVVLPHSHVPTSVCAHRGDPCRCLCS
jgi:hypothetical protein